MAKKAKSKTAKIQPAVRTLTFTIPALTADETKYIDLSQCASLVNRRFYRQGLNWAVAGFTLHATSGTTGEVQIMKVPTTWVAGNAWEKAMRAWLKQQNDAIEEAGAESAVARFRDFKIHADEGHVAATFGSNLLPAVYDAGTGTWQAFTAGEWDPSQIVIPNATSTDVAPHESFLHMTGTNFYPVGSNAATAQSRGIIEGYADSRAYPQSPDPVGPAIGSANNWLRDMFDDGNDSNAITINATDRNDNLPYDQVNYPNGELNANELQYHDQIALTTSTISAKSTGRGGAFPCGLIKLRLSQGLSSVEGIPQAWLQVHLVPGTHRGYLCEPMTDM
jgi:hypothetical protein